MREAFDGWGDALGARDFGRALLALGLRGSTHGTENATELTARLSARWRRARRRPMPWKLPVRPDKLGKWRNLDPRRLAEAGEGFLAEVARLQDRYTPGVRLEIAPPGWTTDWDELAATLLFAGVDGAYVRESFEGEAVWGWPLRIVVSDGLFEPLSLDDWSGKLYRCSRLHEARQRAHLLILEEAFPDAVARLLADTRPPGADVLVVLGGLGGDRALAPRMVDVAARRIGADGVLVLDAPEEDRPTWEIVFGLIGNLSHALPLDVAAKRAVESSRPFLVASRELIEATNLRRQIGQMADRMQRMEGVAIRVPERAMEDLALANGGPGVHRFDAADVGRAIESALPRMEFEAETGDATVLAELAEEAGPELERAEANQETRFLQTRIEDAEGETVNPKGKIGLGNSYRVAVRIAHDLATDGIGLPRPFPFPAPRPDGQPQRLSVFFWEQVISPEPQVQTLLLPQRGDTEFCYFPFRAPAEPVRIAARIAIFHRNRNLQTGVLRGAIGEESANLTFTIDAAPFPRFSGLAERQGIGAALIFNDDDTGTPRVFSFANGRAAQTDLSEDPSDMQQFKQGMGEDIAAITAQPERFNGLRAPGSIDLLVQMARRGGNLLRMLKHRNAIAGQLHAADHVQVVCARAGAFFPAEYLYEGRIPDAKTTREPDEPADTPITRVCGGAPGDAEAALKTGECCGAYAQNPRHTVCPLRFWSLSKVIERHAFEPEHAGLPADFQLRASPPTERNQFLRPLTSGLLAASEKANKRVPTTVDDLKGQVEAVLDRKPLVVPSDWTQWEAGVTSEKPSLLVLLPHHGKQGASDYLEIGAGKREDIIVETYVQAEDAPAIHPVVLLIGCETSESKVGFEGFVPQFQIGGAAIVVTTIASILGRQAGPVAGALVEEIEQAARAGNVAFGQIMLQARRNLLAGGTPMVLGLTSYGDADWLIAH